MLSNRSLQSPSNLPGDDQPLNEDPMGSGYEIEQLGELVAWTVSSSNDMCFCSLDSNVGK